VRRSDIVASGLVAQLPPDRAVAAVRRGRATVVGVEPAEVVVADGSDGFAAIDALAPGFWVGWCAFELGHASERVRTRGASLEPPMVADVVFARFDALAVVDAAGAVTVRGDGAGRPLLDAAVVAASRGPAPSAGPGLVTSGEWRTSLEHDVYCDRVDAVLELLRAGECYQVNLTRRLTCDRALDPVALYTALAHTHPAPYTTLLRFPDLGPSTAVVAASPECYLRRRGARVATRPIKGTAATRATLRSSAKDHAENVMIVDLARNDLGRVCTPGSIAVPELCAIESHPGLHHLVSTVRGRLRDGIGTGALVEATFPPASVTGAPKPRVLQAIEDLEPVRRGVYCGAVGWIDTATAAADLAVAIRTFTIVGEGDAGRTHLGVGGGVVADSRPDAEWRETELKASRLLRAAGADLPARVAS
jgi:para-aminobenzoate synthetase component 1